ncbi:hypothetical protein [Bacillus pumilus]|uniref:hypothetical protein n=1 Tax=Bacillus pumilus TaxID=1408 RepID=UPI0025A2F330|nr:hypothetical protein [Bacillus pumilus]
MGNKKNILRNITLVFVSSFPPFIQADELPTYYAHGPLPSMHLAEYQVRKATKPITFPPIPIFSKSLATSL